ncbi:MAG: hypothetical protein JSR87_15055 [Proteobacteria bacterium]|nr:hypothetical protein [Pseudomonadota bacterium]MBS0573579.1 hypothetical protein [Pseudomonadota bacterium]
MAEQPTNLDMFDVLSSIRRLVSEERKGPLPRVEPAPPAAPRPLAEVAAAPEPARTDESAADQPSRYAGLPRESRFVLTAALRVADEGDEGAEATAIGREWEREAAGGHAAPAPSSAAADAPADPGDLARRTASLEETIAELEAAVADIGAEFEPDGGEPDDLVAELFPGGAGADAAGAATDALADGGRGSAAEGAGAPRAGEYRGIMAGFDAISLGDEPLDAPITGEALIPPARPTRDPAPAPSPAVAGFTHAAAAGSPAGLGETHHPSLAEALAQSDAEVRRADDPQRDELSGGADAGDEWQVRPDGENGAAETVAAGEEELGETAAADEAGQGEAAIDAGDDALAGNVEDAGGTEPPARTGRPQILRPSWPGDDLAGEELAAGDLADMGGPLSAHSAESDGGSDLFDPLVSDDLDVDALRDMVAELVREELRGVLGERITRNLRALVRQEIRKAMTESGRA